MFKKIATYFFLAVAVFNIFAPVFNNRNKFLEKFDVKLYEKKYNNSQYVIPRSKNPISDEELLSYAGYKYATGLNPILINSDHPPLGKYIIGWSTLLTGNSRTVSLFFALANLVLLMLIVFTITKSRLLSVMALFFASLDTVFLDQVIYSPVLDIIQLFFFLFSSYIFLVWVKTKKNLLFVPLGISLGAFSAAKLYFPAIIFSLVIFLISLATTKKFIKSGVLIFLTVVLAFITYAASYTRYFMLGNSFRSFFGVQKWIFLFWKNNSIQVAKYYGGVIPLILFNRWKVWWGNKQYINFEHWSIFWPIFFILGIVSILYFFSKGYPRNFYSFSAHFFSIWASLFTIYLCLIPISPRYLMLLYFPIYILVSLFIGIKFKKYV